jgi:hypothetical protein
LRSRGHVAILEATGSPTSGCTRRPQSEGP